MDKASLIDNLLHCVEELQKAEDVYRSAKIAALECEGFVKDREMELIFSEDFKALKNETERKAHIRLHSEIYLGKLEDAEDDLIIAECNLRKARYAFWGYHAIVSSFTALADAMPGLPEK